MIFVVHPIQQILGPIKWNQKVRKYVCVAKLHFQAKSIHFSGWRGEEILFLKTEISSFLKMTFVKNEGR